MENNYKDYIIKNGAGYTYRTNTVDLDYLFDRYKKGEVDLNLACQRDYVWSEEFQQELWDTILNGDRIPEVHAVIKERTMSIFDGKQRFTTLFRILGNSESGISEENRIPLYLKGNLCRLRNPEYFIKNFVKKDKQKNNKIFFEDLTETCQNYILNTYITMAEYSNVSDDALALLFRKLNTADGLSKFLIAISRNIKIRLNYTTDLIDHPIFSWMQEVETIKDRKEKSETLLVRLAFLENFGPCDLAPKNLSTKMNEINITTLSDIKNIYKRIFDLFDKETIQFLTKNWQAHETYFPLCFYLLKNYDVSQLHIKKIFNNPEITKFVTTQHANLTKKEVQERLNNLQIFIETQLEEIDKST